MELILPHVLIFCVSLSLILAVKTTTVLTYQDTKGMRNITSVTMDPATLTSPQHTDNINISSLNMTTSTSLSGETKLVSPTSTTYSSHVNINSHMELSQTPSSSPTSSSSSSTVANNSGDDTELSESLITKQMSNISSPEDVTQVTPTKLQNNSLTMLAFGVMSFILVLIIVMIILVTAVNLKGRCRNTKEDGVKDSVISESNIPITGEKESITLVSVRSINTDTDTDSPQISSIHSTILDSEEQDLSVDLLCVRAGQ